VAALWQLVTNEDTPLNDFLRASDFDGDPLPYSLVSLPTSGVVQFNPATGVFAYTPAANFNGNDGFTFKVNDGTTDSNVTRIFIGVRPVNDAPVAVAGRDQTADEAVMVAFDGRGSYDVDGDSLTYLWNFGDGRTGTGPTPVHTYEDDGTYTVALTVSDGNGSSSVDSLLVTVNNVVPVAGSSGPPVRDPRAVANVHLYSRRRFPRRPGRVLHLYDPMGRRLCAGDVARVGQPRHRSSLYGRWLLHGADHGH